MTRCWHTRGVRIHDVNKGETESEKRWHRQSVPIERLSVERTYVVIPG